MRAVDFLVELLVQFVVQVVLELLGELLIEVGYHGTAKVLRNRITRNLLGMAAGLGVGLAWGQHLSGGAHWPKLLWVSLVLAVAAAVLAGRRPRGQGAGWEQPLSPPWRWTAERLFGFCLLNLALATGILLTFRPA
jgi:hypothetical protein